MTRDRGNQIEASRQRDSGLKGMLMADPTAFGEALKEGVRRVATATGREGGWRCWIVWIGLWHETGQEAGRQVQITTTLLP